MEQAKNKKARAAHLKYLVNHYWGSINHVMGLIRASEIKVGLILSFYGVLLNFIYLGAGSWVDLAKFNFVYGG